MQSDVSRCVQMPSLRALRTLTCIGMLAGMVPALSAPVVQQVGGVLNHKGSITITGSGFGSKATAAPVVWDDATGSDISNSWDGAWPNATPSYNTNYYSPMRGINPPHSHDARYIAGAHATSTGANSGYNVVVFKNISLQPFPFHIYASWYQRADTAWIFGGDNNYKTFAYSICCSPYEMPNNWYTAYGPPHPSSKTDSAQWLFTDDGGSMSNPDVNGHNVWWDTAVNPMAGTWSKVEIAIKVTDQTNGYVKMWENGHQVMGYVGPTDKYPGTRRTIGIGGYARMQEHSNWRYFDDVYLDTTLSHVVLADKPLLSQAKIIENQIPSSWSDGSITVTVNLGQFTQGQTAYLFVVDSSGTPSAAGLAVTAGGTVATPSAPSAVSVH